MTNILVAYDEARAVGKNNDLPWGRCLPGDLMHFRKLSLGASVLMGRKTFESLPSSLRPLPGRENIVLSHNPALAIEGVLCVSSLAQALKSASGEVFVIGGGQIFTEALPITNKIFATEVHEVFADADTFFPPLDENEWHEVSREPRSKSHTEIGDKYDYDFVIYERTK